MTRRLLLDGNMLSLEEVLLVAHKKADVFLAQHAKENLENVRTALEKLMLEKKPVYGLNTGFGALAETYISEDKLELLQRNLILSHAVGLGAPLNIPQARALLLLRANTLAKGHSGIRSQLVEAMLLLLNAGCAPYVPSKGSVGASGDLAPLSHLALLLLGIGDAYVDNKRVSALDALEHAGLQPAILQAREGLALINGTQAMAAVGGLCVLEAERLCGLSTKTGALTLFALNGLESAFDERVHAVRPHAGQVQTAAHLRLLLKEAFGKDKRVKTRVQDPYSLRCMPQVHGASHDAIAHAKSVLACEINSATDNPLIFMDKDGQAEMISGGNFHGQYLALALDYVAMAVAELGSIAERRIEQMVNTHLSGLPAFLTPQPGLNSGFMMLHVTASALVNENKVLCHPASTDSIPTSAGREDHVSMGMTSANKLSVIVENVQSILAIELMAACQALDLQGVKPHKGFLRELYNAVRAGVPFAQEDRLYGEDLQSLLRHMQQF